MVKNISYAIGYTLVILLQTTCFSASDQIPNRYFTKPNQFSIYQLEGTSNQYKLVAKNTFKSIESKSYIRACYVFQNKFKDSVVMLSFPKWSLAKIYRNGIFLGKSGTQVPFNERIIGIANKVYFPIQIKPGDKAKIDVELWNNPSQLSIPNGLNAQILPFNKAIKNSMRERQVAYFFMLVIFFIFLYNIFFVYVKYHKGRIMYLFLLLFYLASAPLLFNYSIEYFDFQLNYPDFHPLILVVFLSCLTITFLFFTKQKLFLKKYYPISLKICRISVALIGFCALWVIIYPSWYSYRFFLTVIILIDLMIYFTGILAYSKKIKESTFFLVASTFSLVGILSFLFGEIGLLETSVLTRFGLITGLTLEAVTYAISVGYGIHEMNKRRVKIKRVLELKLEKNEKLNQELSINSSLIINDLKDKYQELENLNHQIIDTIQETKTFQEDLQEFHNALSEYSEGSFIFHQPKNIEYGDFHWSYRVNSDVIIWAIIDLNSDEMPKAIIGAICHLTLYNIVQEKGISRVDLVMNFFKNELRKKVFLQMKDKSSFENIAITICRFDKRTRQLTFVSDNSGVAVVNNNEVLDFSKLTHLSASNGKNHIITHETIFELAKGETIFTFNSGFSSQFGGVQHKRYGMINFKNFLIKLSNIDISLRKVEIENTFNAWKGEERQGKDLLILSLEVME